jgi:hypothetical protein
MLNSGFIDTYLRLNAKEEEIFRTEVASAEATDPFRLQE